MSDVVAACIAQACASPKRLVLPEGGDERIVAAARRLRDEGIALPILLGAPAELNAAAMRAGVSLDGLAMLDPSVSPRLPAYIDLYATSRPDTNPKVASRLLRK